MAHDGPIPLFATWWRHAQSWPARRRLLLVVVVAGLFAGSGVLLQPAAAAQAATIVVNTAIDEDADPGAGCSLREAIVAANTDSPYGGCDYVGAPELVDAINFLISTVGTA